MQGRDRLAEKFSSRTLDLDIILYGNEQLNLPGLEIPRDEIFRYAFVLQPLADLVPAMICPGTDQTFLEIWHDFQAGRELDEARIVDWHPFQAAEPEKSVK